MSKITKTEEIINLVRGYWKKNNMFPPYSEDNLKISALRWILREHIIDTETVAALIIEYGTYYDESLSESDIHYIKELYFPTLPLEFNNYSIEFNNYSIQEIEDSYRDSEWR